MTKLTLVFGIVFAATLASGCATVNTDTAQPVALHPNPAGAMCDVTREL